MNRKLGILGVAGALLLPALAVAAFSVPHSFSAGEVISSQQMNSNFAAIKTELEALQTINTARETENAALKGRLDALEKDVVWTEPQLVTANGWNISAVYSYAGYRKENGILYLKGRIGNETPGNLNKVIFILPVGYRPPERRVVTTTFALSADDQSRHVRLDIHTNGEVRTETTLGDAKWVSLDGISCAL